MTLAEHANRLSAQNRLRIFNRAQYLGESRLLFGKLCISELAEIMQFNHSACLQYTACYSILIPALWVLPQLSFYYSYVFPLTYLRNVVTYFSSPTIS